MGYDRLPMFPLPDVVLFPHAILPLHVFEPRYKALTQDILAGDGMLVIARLRPGYGSGPEEAPPVFEVAGLGEIVEHHALEDGRCNIFIRGISRVRIEAELPSDHPYRLVKVERLYDSYSGADLGISASALQALAAKLADVLPHGGETLRAIVEDAAEPGTLADVLAASVIVDPAERQQLLETLDVGARLGRVSLAIAELLRRFVKPERAPMN